MKLTLLKGCFEKEESLVILQQLFEVKIKFHENKIQQHGNEEDIKMREQRIKQLQHDLMEARKHIEQQGNFCDLQSEIHIQ